MRFTLSKDGRFDEVTKDVSEIPIPWLIVLRSLFVVFSIDEVAFIGKLVEFVVVEFVVVEFVVVEFVVLVELVELVEFDVLFEFVEFIFG